MILVIYDVSNNKRRRKIVRLLESYGIRVQKSAFECDVSKASVETIKKRAAGLIDETQDSIRFYSMNCYSVIFSIGGKVTEQAEEYDVI